MIGHAIEEPLIFLFLSFVIVKQFVTQQFQHVLMNLAMSSFSLSVNVINPL